MKDTIKKLAKYSLIPLCILLFSSILLSCKYKETKSYHEGLAAVGTRDNKWGYIDEKKKEVIPCIYLSANNFINGAAIVKNTENKYGLIDKTGNEIIPFKYDSIDRKNSDTTGLAIVTISKKYGLVTMDGKEIVPCEYDNIKYGLNIKERYIGNKGKDNFSFDYNGNVSPYIYRAESRNIGTINVPEQKFALLDRETGETMEELKAILVVSDKDKFILQNLGNG